MGKRRITDTERIERQTRYVASLRAEASKWRASVPTSKKSRNVHADQIAYWTRRANEEQEKLDQMRAGNKGA